MKDRRITVDEIPEWKDDRIKIDISGLDLQFQASKYRITIFIDEDEADKIAFQLQSILQDIERRKDLTKCK
jgi:hypothetical protein